MIETVWKFSVGDLVFHEEMGSGIVENRTLQTFHVMARPIKMVEKQMYKVLFSTSESFIRSEGDHLSLVQKAVTL